MRSSQWRTCGPCYEIYSLETVTFLSWCPTGSVLYDLFCEQNNKQDRLTGPWPHHSTSQLTPFVPWFKHHSEAWVRKKKLPFFLCFILVLYSCFQFKNTRKISFPVLPLKVSPFSKFILHEEFLLQGYRLSSLPLHGKANLSGRAAQICLPNIPDPKSSCEKNKTIKISL